MKTEHIYNGWKAVTGVLAPRETEVLTHLIKGESNKVIAKALGISPHTTKKTLKRVMYKLDTYSRTETLAVAIQRGILSPPVAGGK
ncbi:LuxR C-terminal-related transcriptional regulator [Dasania marina]|uniref:response regulator transcription factor n=1 Tax=Dasania marina TaxID=471499 RepID=UPI0030DBC62C|tara:strand:- start:3399 stop:3656 length:258 start_codon:yes stop_codon:yes gene_type:complete